MHTVLTYLHPLVVSEEKSAGSGRGMRGKPSQPVGEDKAPPLPSTVTTQPTDNQTGTPAKRSTRSTRHKRKDRHIMHAIFLFPAALKRIGYLNRFNQAIHFSEKEWC